MFEQASPKQETGNHKEQCDAGQANLRIKVARRDVYLTRVQIDPRNGDVMDKHPERQIPAQSIHTGKTVFADMLKASPDTREIAEQQR